MNLVRPIPRRLALAFLLLTLANLTIFLTDLIVVQAFAIFVLTVLLPGLLLLSLLPHRGDSDGIQHLAIGLGLGYAIAILGTLFLHYLPGPMTRTQSMVLYNVLTMGLLIAWYVGDRKGRLPTLSLNIPPRGILLALVILIVIGAFFRFTNLYYAEFQGDEVTVLHKAAECIQGRGDAIFLHKKGPAEILLSANHYAITRRTNEWMARFPFALANLIGVLALYALGREALSDKGAWWATLLVALNGFYVAFGRIVQYQSLVFLFGTLGLLAALRFAHKAKRVDLYLSAIFSAMGLLAHSDAIFAVVASAFVILKALYQRHRGHRMDSAVIALLGPVLLAGVVLASFYLPFVMHPHFEMTQSYLRQRTGTRPPYNNLDVLANLGTVYNAIYYLAFLAFALAWILMRHVTQWKRTGWAFLGIYGAVSATRLLFPNIWHIGERDLTGLLFLLPIAFLFLTAEEDIGWQSALVWFGTPFLIYMFGFRQPRTHIYTFFPGAALLVGEELGRLHQARRKTWSVWGATGIILLVSASYLHITFISHTPEYQRTYPDNYIPLFWTPYGAEKPEHGLFGFPYRAGWKVVGNLYASGALEGDYGTNEETHITRWYTRGEHACQIRPHYYFVAENVQDEQAVPHYDMESDYYSIESDYTHFGTVWVDDTPKLRLYEYGEASLPYRDYQASEAVPSFDQHLTDPGYPTGLPPQDPLSHIQYPMYRKLGQNIELLGYSVNKTHIDPGDPLVLTLYWRALGKMAESYTVFTHIDDSGDILAQKDHPPLCGNNPTDKWEPGHIYVDPYVIVIDTDISPGTYSILSGMYRFDTGERLPVLNKEGVQLGDAMKLDTITVRGK